MGYQIAIDGPCGSGKSTLAKNLATLLDIKYVDTGSMYRAVGYYLQQNNIDLSDIELVENNLDKINLSMKYVDDLFYIFLNGENVTNELRTQKAADSASKVATIPKVREKLVKFQKEISYDYDVVMEGRDIGFKVLENADLKIFLDASTEVRASRRIKELNEKGTICDFDTVKKEIEDRDYRDYNREFDPLAKALDAIYIDASNYTEEEIIEKIISLTNDKKRT